MTVQASPSFLTMLSITVLLLVSDNTTSAHADDNSVPVHGQGSSHNPIVYHPVHGQGSTHDPIVHRTKPPICPGAGLPTCKPLHPPCRIVNGQCSP